MAIKNKELPVLKIGKHQPKYPIIQGGMGIMVSGPKLAAAVAAEGGIGTIASVGLAASSDGFDLSLGPKKISENNQTILARYIKEAKEASNGGVIAVNCMCALSDYEDLVRTSCEAGADVIISGAGLPLKLPQLTEGHPDTALVPIVSSVKAAGLIISRWLKHYNRIPDAFVVETPNTAGGHLGARSEEEALDEKFSLKEVVPALVKYIRELGLSIPVVAAGGIWDSQDIDEAIELGASGVQMGTRFAATKEGDASDRFKEAYINANEDDVVLLKSPCGLPWARNHEPAARTLLLRHARKNDLPRRLPLALHLQAPARDLLHSRRARQRLPRRLGKRPLLLRQQRLEGKIHNEGERAHAGARLRLPPARAELEPAR